MKKLALLILFFVFNSTVTAKTLPTAVAQREQNIYAAPELIQAVVGSLSTGTSLVIEGRDETGVWLLVDTPSGMRGWVATTSNQLGADFSLYDLPIASTIIPFDPAKLSPISLSTNSDTQATIKRLQAAPIFDNLNTPAVYSIFQLGQKLGEDANIFAKVGDSNTTSGDFLYPMGLIQQCDLGPFNNLQDTIRYFLTPISISGNSSFTRTSQAAKKGLGSSGALDPMWAGGSCLGHEGPVACEYRLIKPAVAMITIGLMDVHYQTPPNLFRENIEQLVQLSINQGIIPVLTNIIVLPNQDALSFDVSMQVDNTLLDIADQYQIPHINLWRAAQSLPDFGIGPDHTHMRHVVGSYCNFTGAEQTVGGTLRNLLTLEALDTLRRNVLLTSS